MAADTNILLTKENDLFVDNMFNYTNINIHDSNLDKKIMDTVCIDEKIYNKKRHYETHNHLDVSINNSILCYVSDYESVGVENINTINESGHQYIKWKMIMMI